MSNMGRNGNIMFDKIKAVAMDVDGVLTDGTFWWGQNGCEMKRFCFADRTGIPLAQQAGILIALVSGESSPDGMAIVDRYAKKLNIDIVYKGCHDKKDAIRQIAEDYNLKLSEICFMGDDVNDLPAMAVVGISVAPANARLSVIKKADFVTKQEGGHGAVRELLDLIIESNNKA